MDGIGRQRALKEDRAIKVRAIVNLITSIILICLFLVS